MAEQGWEQGGGCSSFLLCKLGNPLGLDFFQGVLPMVLGILGPVAAGVEPRVGSAGEGSKWMVCIQPLLKLKTRP